VAPSATTRKRQFRTLGDEAGYALASVSFGTGEPSTAVLNIVAGAVYPRKSCLCGYEGRSR
jgi:hypothetical protein